MAGKPRTKQEAAEARARALLTRPVSKARKRELQRLGIEAEKLRRVPGIVFADGPAGRRARIFGTGLEVFEVIEDYLDIGRDRAALDEIYDWLTPAQLDAALAYYTAYPEEIDEWIALGEALERMFDRRRE